jgi:Leishmanolysin
MNKALVFVLVVSTVTVSVGKSVVAADCGKSPCPVNAVPRGLQGTVALTGLDLIDSLTEKRITTLTNNQVIVVDQIPGMTTPSFNINATFVGSAVKSVVFGYGATTYRTDNFAPFSFCGNMGPLFNTCSLLGLGTHVVTATPYSFQGGGGIVGSPVTVTFTVVASAPKPPTMAPKAPTKAPSAPTPVAAPSTAVVSNYNIQLDLSKITTAADQTVFASAAAKWQSVVTGDLTSFDTRNLPPRDDGCQWPSIIDDLFVCAGYQAIDGPSNVLGFAGPEYIRNSNGLPFSGVMTFDIDDLTRLRGNGGGKFLSTILHEMGHVLGTSACSCRGCLAAFCRLVPLTFESRYAIGIGTLWDNRNVADPAPNCNYVGSNANREFTAISGCSSVPVERDFGGGTACGHWDEECMGNELMTGFLGPSTSPLSRITVATLQDLGYQVDYSKADAFGRSDLAASCTCPVRRLRPKDRSVMEMKRGKVFSLATATSGRNAIGGSRRRLSETAEAMAIEAGLEYLQTNAQYANDTQVDDLGITYVADKIVSVLVLENGEIYGVTVIQPDE